MYDLKNNLVNSAIVLLSLIFIGTAFLLTLVAESAAVALLLPILLILLAVVGIILTFVPFFKDNIRLIPVVDAVVGIIVAVIIHFLC